MYEPAWLSSKTLKKVYKQFLPCGFAITVIWAILWPEPGDHCAHIVSNGWKVVSTINMIIIFLIFGISIETKELKSALKAWKALLLGLTTILVWTSFLGFLPLKIPMKPYEFSIGMAIFSCVPTSLSSGVTLVIQGYGNGALALLFTVASNALGIVTAPIFVKLVLGGEVAVDAVSLLIKLSVSILLPLVVGKAAREVFPAVAKIAKIWKLPLGMLNSFQIMMIVWQTLSYSQKVLMEQELIDIIMAIIAAVVQHLFFFIICMLLGFLFYLPEKERKAFVIMASQKALPIAAVIILQLDPAQVGNLGLISMPCIVFYVMQLFIDAYICNAWASKYENRAAVIEKRYGEQLKALENMAAMEAELGITWSETWHPLANAPAATVTLGDIKVEAEGATLLNTQLGTNSSSAAAWRS